MPVNKTISFSLSDLDELQRLLDDLFGSNSLVFERLVSALSRLGLRVSINSVVTLYPRLEVAKQEIINTLKKGMSHVKQA